MKRLLRVLLFLILGLLLVIVIKTIRFSSRQLTVAPVRFLPVGAAPVERLSKAIQISTISAQLQQDSSDFYRFSHFLDEQYPLVDSLLDKQYFGAFSRLYTWPGRNPNLKPVMLIAHLDVVDIANPSAWIHEAFSGDIADDFIWGRGTLDDKVSVLGILEAVESLLSSGYVPERTLYLGFGHDEEIEGSGAQAIARYLEAQNIELEYILDEGYYVIEEALPGLEPPLALIGISEKGYVTLELEVQLAEGGHSSMPAQPTAIGVLSAALHKLDQEPFPAKIQGPLKEMFQHAGPEMRPVFKAVFANLWLTRGLLKRQLAAAPASNALLRTTTAPTILRAGMQENVLPTSAQATINFRIIPGETAESVLERVENLVANEYLSVRIKSNGIYDDPSPVASTEGFGYQVLSRTIREVFPEAIVAPNVSVGATDVRHYAAVCDNLYRFLPLQLQQSDLSRIHGSNERVAVDQYKRAIRWYEQLIRNSCR